MRSPDLFETAVMLSFILHGLFILMVGIVYCLCEEALLDRVRGRKSEALLCEPAGIFAKGSYGKPLVRVKYALPWVPNPDLSDCPRSAYPLLVVTRLSAWLSLVASLSAAVFWYPLSAGVFGVLS